jgi:ABC-2 type transport system ATP-binding protein
MSARRKQRIDSWITSTGCAREEAIMNETPVVKLEHVTRDFGATRALQDINLEIPGDTVVGVLGPNGGGKTTLLRHMAGLALPTSGTVTTFGADAARLDDARLSRIGFVSQETELLGWLDCGELIAYVRAGQPRWNDDLADRLVREYEIDRRKRIGSLSSGQRQRLAILLGVAHEPDLLLLDEPASALDPIARQDFLDLLIGMVQVPGRTILISSHILTDVEKVIDRVLILVAGRVRYFGTLDELRESFHRVEITDAGEDQPAIVGAVNVERSGRSTLVTIEGRTRDQVLAEMARLGLAGSVTPLTFEEIYRALAGGR